MAGSERTYVSRAGSKLAAALRAFDVAVEGCTCIDLGSHTGGFVDCLLQHGAGRVYAVDPGYGVLHHRLRSDPRVVVCERTNAFDFVAPELADLVTIDVGWTPQRLILPVARRCLKPHGRVISLIKPHYEAPRTWLRQGVLPTEHAAEVLAACREDVLGTGAHLLGTVNSPLPGLGGNQEYLWLLAWEIATPGTGVAAEPQP